MIALTIDQANVLLEQAKKNAKTATNAFYRGQVAMLNDIIANARPHVTIHARRWFDRVNGNTYHSVCVWVGKNEVGMIPFEYGYDDMYLQTAYTLLAPVLGYAAYDEFLADKRANPDYFQVNVQDVSRKKDLHK